MLRLLCSALLVLQFSASAQSYFTPQVATEKLQSHQSALSELHLKLLARESPKGGYERAWKRLALQAFALEGVIACADAVWYYEQFEPQIVATQNQVGDPEQFFAQLTRLVALTSYRYERISAQYEQKGCAQDGVRKAVVDGRAANERSRAPLKGITLTK
ncbi:MAG: hypothetical protein RJA97_1071 [Bacteroidota bacterium]|jgi:hypothetical protein